MKISEVISQLELIKEEYGDVPVFMEHNDNEVPVVPLYEAFYSNFLEGVYLMGEKECL